MTTGKTIALTLWTFVGKVIFPPFNMLSKFVMAFLPKKQVSFNFMVVFMVHSDFEAQDNKAFKFFPICHEVMELGAMILVF